MTLRKNQLLEIVPGDKITVSYSDPSVVTEEMRHHEAFLTATFHNAVVSASFVEYTVDSKGERHARYIPMRRFKPGDKISVFINDPDCDVSDKQDVVKFTARTSQGKPVELPALETEPHSGVFVGGLFPVATDPKRKSEIKVAEGDDIIISYLDAENTDPGIPWPRTTTAEQTWYEGLLPTPDRRGTRAGGRCRKGHPRGPGTRQSDRTDSRRASRIRPAHPLARGRLAGEAR